ncbi:MAG: extracellular solute-binding protein [Eubacteriales bacterium]
MRRMISVILLCTMLGITIVGCSSGNGGGGATTSTTPLEPMEYDNTKASWEQVQTPITLEWFVAYDWIDLSFDTNNNEFSKYILENTGITIEYTIGSLEKLNALIATNNLPDIISYDAVSSERLLMEDSGMLLSLDGLIESYAPDFSVADAQKDWYRNENDGEWYAFVGYFYDVEDTYERGSSIESHNMNFARQDIMNELGITPESMTTKEGFIAALEKVKEANYQYNGQTVIPFLSDYTDHLAEQFGMDREDENGNLLSMTRQPEYLEALLFMNEIYNKGLTTDEIFTMDEVIRQQLVSSGSVFAGINHVYLRGKDTLYYNDPAALMMGIGHIEGDGGKESIVSPSPTAGWAATMISSNCKDPQRAISLLSFMSQQEISLAYYYGGIDGYDIVDGKAIIKEERAVERDADASAFSAKYHSTIQDIVCDYVWVKAFEPQDNLDAIVVDKLAYTEKWIDGHIFDDKIFNDVSPESGSDLIAIQAQIDTYWEQQYPLIIMAATQEEAIQIYNDSIAQMETMGSEDVLEYSNEKFQDNKEKMGLEFAWPRNQ